MPDLALGVFLVILVSTVVIVTQVTIARRRAPQKHPHARWKVEEHPREISQRGPTAYALYCVHPDEERQLVDAVRWDDPDFETKLEEARVEAILRCAALNNKRLIN